jgi:hypothetical protein
MLVYLFYHIDEFCKLLKATRITDGSESATGSRLSDSEIMTICVYFHYSGFKTFKDYYIKSILRYHKSEFKNLVSYSRFVELKQEIALDLGVLALLLCHINKCTGTSFIDSFSLPICHNKRIYSHKVFKGFAQRGKTSVGWFFGFKVHIVIDQMGNLLNFYFTPGNVADNNENVLKSLLADIFGKAFGDKGYIVKQELFKFLYLNGIELVNKVRSNMKSKLMNFADKLILSKRGVVESVIDIIKIHLSVDHSRHRSTRAFLSNLFSGLIAYAFYPTKPSIALKVRAIG